MRRERAEQPSATTTRHPFRASTRIVARFTDRNQRSWMHPARIATVPRAGPAGSVTRGRGRRSSAQVDARNEALEPRREERPHEWIAADSSVISRPWSRTTSRPTYRAARDRNGRPGEACAFAASINRPYGTWDGHTSSQARHPRQRSMNLANVVSTPAAPSLMARHCPDPAARGGRLVAGQTEGRAMRQAQSAADAGEDVMIRGAGGRSASAGPRPRQLR